MSMSLPKIAFVFRSSPSTVKTVNPIKESFGGALPDVLMRIAVSAYTCPRVQPRVEAV